MWRIYEVYYYASSEKWHRFKTSPRVRKHFNFPPAKKNTIPSEFANVRQHNGVLLHLYVALEE